MRRLRLAFGFFTILPLGRSGSMEEIASAGFLLPVVALVLGGMEGLAGWGLSQIFGIYLTAALILVLAFLLTGLHHADGLADVGDAVLAGGGPERRLAVLKDRTMGIGGLTALVFTFVISWASLTEILPSFDRGSFPWLLMAIEVSARLALISLAALSRPSHRGSGSAFIAGLKGWRSVVALGITLLFLSLLVIPLGITVPSACGTGALAVAIFLTAAGRRWFGGANGDLLGASVEAGRMAALLGAAAVL